MDSKSKRKFEIAKEIAECSTKYTFNQIMKMSKKGFRSLYKMYLKYVEVKDEKTPAYYNLEDYIVKTIDISELLTKETLGE